MRFFSKVLFVVAISCFSTGLGWSADDDFLLPPPPPSADGGLELPPPPPPPSSVVATDEIISTETTDLTPPPPAPVVESELALPVVQDDTLINEEVDVLTPAPVYDNASQGGVSAASIDLGGVEGKITGGRVNIRAGQSTKYEIVLTADIDTPVTVYEKVGDWVKIAYPAGEYCYINQKYLSGELPTDIPEQGLVREVRGNNVNLRARPWPGSTVVGQVSSGDSVFITGIRGQWVRIRPPASAKAWVFYKYVSYEGGVKESASPASVAKADNDPEDEYGNKLKTAADDIIKQSRNNPIIAKIKARAEAERNARNARRNAASNIMNSVEDQLARIEREAAEQKEQAYRRSQENKKYEAAYRAEMAKDFKPGPPPGSMGYDATGWLEYIGYVNGRTAGYRIVKGGDTIYLLRSLYYDLDDFVGKHVRVSGSITPDRQSNYSIMDVKRLSLYNGTYISPNTQVLEQGREPAEYDVSERVTITEDRGFEPMVEEDVVIENRRAVVGDSYDVTGMVTE